MSTLDRGLDEHGHIRREGDLARLQPEFAGLVHAYAAGARESFGSDLHSIYLYGSIPRGTARPGVSDLDGQLLLGREPTETDRASARDLEDRLGAAHPEVSSVGVLLDARAALVDPADRWDGGFHLRVLCTPLWGPDAGAEVAPHEPGPDLARAVQGDWRGALDRLRAEVAGAARLDPERAVPGCRSTGRRLARVAFTWVMPRWGGWTSDPAVMQQVVDLLEPGWSAPMRASVRLGWGGAPDLDLAQHLLTGWAAELTVRGNAIGA